ncbi:uncharacterized protein LOC114852785 isoform X1 [Betta splendens]|uniref:Uncharacterized protein LOC114852785 isoform X1 n=1 Tax=Betta splendens TaxID=158456 RepID=A0A6P7M4Z0_BETSP|nr:uncharacterized protein LOC114852785 isoform X1 [Betta splendens]
MQQPVRKRLRPWLEEQIQSGRYPGVSWLDQSARIFQIPWKHAARHGWSIDRDATLFRSWAMHTGRYRPGKDKPDPKTWKANFRCALNSLPDICELQEYSRKRGSNAYRVYRMLPSAQTHRRRKGSARALDLRTFTRRRGPARGDAVCVPHRSLRPADVQQVQRTTSQRGRRGVERAQLATGGGRSGGDGGGARVRRRPQAGGAGGGRAGLLSKPRDVGGETGGAGAERGRVQADGPPEQPGRVEPDGAERMETQRAVGPLALRRGREPVCSARGQLLRPVRLRLRQGPVRLVRSPADAAAAAAVRPGRFRRRRRRRRRRVSHAPG